jgi:methyltransferase
VTTSTACGRQVISAWLTALVFSIANALVLNVRIRADDAALRYA